MSKLIKAIKTEYRGVIYDSKMEAQWAVFFSCLPNQWFPQPETLQHRELGTYTPDFFVYSDQRSGVGYYFEIKPLRPRPEYVNRISQFSVWSYLVIGLGNFYNREPEVVTGMYRNYERTYKLSDFICTHFNISRSLTQRAIQATQSFRFDI